MRLVAIILVNVTRMPFLQTSLAARKPEDLRHDVANSCDHGHPEAFGSRVSKRWGWPDQLLPSTAALRIWVSGFEKRRNHMNANMETWPTYKCEYMNRHAALAMLARWPTNGAHGAP